MSDDEYHKNRDPRLKKREPAPPGEFPPPPGTLDRDDHSDLYPPGEGPIRGSSSRKKSRSRSRSPDGRSRRRDYDSSSRNRDNDEWKNKADAFLQNLGAAPAGMAPQMGMASYPGYQGYPTMGYPYQGQHPGYGPPPQMMSTGAYSMGMDDSRSSSNRTRNRTPPAEKRRRSPTPDQNRDKKTGGITRDQHEKLKAQQKQYHDAKEKLEAQLLKLKEQRETLKEDGAVHDDQIMKENAKLQKEVKSRIQYILDVLGKMDTALQQPILDEVVRRKKSRSPSPKPRHTRSPSPKETRRVQRRATSDNDSSDDQSRHQRRRPRRRSTPPIETKKERSKNRRKSSSSEDEKRKRKKKNKRRKRDSSDDSSSSSSESSDDHKEKSKKTIAKLMNIGDDSVFKMVADLQKGKSGKKSDDVVIGLLSKMSEAYMQAKADNKELVAKLEVLEKDKLEMAEEIEKLKASAKENAIAKTAKIEKLELLAPKKFENTKLVIKDDQEDDDPIMSEEVLKMEEIEKFEKSSSKKQDRNRSVRAKMIEEELSRPRGYKKRSSRSRSNSRSSPSRSRSRSRSKSRSYQRSYSRRSRSRSYDRDRERDRERRRQELEDRERERNKKGSRDRGDRPSRSNDINLDEWRPKTAENPVKIDPTLASIKEKMKHKQDIEMALKQKDDEEKYAKKQSAWTSMSMIDSKKPEMPKMEPTKLEVRPSVNIQWGSSKLKAKTPDPQIGNKKSIQSFVGKMPKKRSVERDSVSPNRSKFGAQVNVPPPEVVAPAVPAPTYLPIRRALPKNPTPKNVDIKDMLAAAKAHMMARGELMPEPNSKKLDMEIPLPPLPAAQDRDPDAMKDTRPVKPPTPPPVREKTELDLMLEKHNAPPGFSGGSGNVVEVTAPPPPAQPPKPAIDMTMYATYAAHWGPGFDPRAVAAAAAIPVPKPQIPPPSTPIDPEETLAAVAEAVPMIENAKEVIEKEEAMDAEELAMLGIDPSDFDGFGQK